MYLILICVQVPHPLMKSSKQAEGLDCDPGTGCCPPGTGDLYYEPWYAGRFKNINELVQIMDIRVQDIKDRLFAVFGCLLYFKPAG